MPRKLLGAAPAPVRRRPHFFDNEVGGSAHGVAKGGLTPFGRQVVARLQDKHLIAEAIAATGGVIGINYFKGAVCERSMADIVASIRHTVRIADVEHVGLGSDFDGFTRTAFDATGLPLVTQGLLGEGFSEGDIAAIMGGNVLRLLQSELPAG